MILCKCFNLMAGYTREFSEATKSSKYTTMCLFTVYCLSVNNYILVKSSTPPFEGGGGGLFKRGVTFSMLSFHFG